MTTTTKDINPAIIVNFRKNMIGLASEFEWFITLRFDIEWSREARGESEFALHIPSLAEDKVWQRKADCLRVAHKLSDQTGWPVIQRTQEMRSRWHL